MSSLARIIFYGSIGFFLVSTYPVHSQTALESQATSISEIKRLRENLLSNYKETDHPGKEAGTITRVLIYFDVKRVNYLDENLQTLSVGGMLITKWQDNRLQWNPSSYSGIKMVRLEMKDIWNLDVYSLFSVKKNDFYKDERVPPVQVYSNGTIKWYTPTTFHIPCSAKYKHYPFDSHNCSMVFGAWTYNGHEIDLETLDMDDVFLYRSNPSSMMNIMDTEWMLTNQTHENEIFRKNDYYFHKFVRVQFYFKRTSKMYKYICTVPAIIVFISSLAGLWLLPSDGKRYLIGCSNVILMSLLLQYLAVTVPAGTEIPLIAQFSATCLCMSGAFLTVSSVTGIIRNCSGQPPHYLVRLAHQHMDQYLCLFSFSDSSASRYSVLGEVSSSPNATTPENGQEEEKQKKDWMVVSLVVDRISFWVFTFVYVVLFGVLASI